MGSGQSRPYTLPRENRPINVLTRPRVRRFQKQAEHWFNALTTPAFRKAFQLRIAPISMLVDAGVIDQKTLTGLEQAAYEAKTRIFYLLNEGLIANAKNQMMTLINMQHEIGHAFWDTLSPEVAQASEALWKAESETKSGPLYENGKLKPGVALGVETDVKEWFAERMAWNNHQWALGRINASSGGESILSNLAFKLRTMLMDMTSILRGQSPDALTAEFRKFLRQGRLDARTRVNSSREFASRDTGDTSIRIEKDSKTSNRNFLSFSLGMLHLVLTLVVHPHFYWRAIFLIYQLRCLAKH